MGDDVDQADVTPVAVIGMACRLPGGIDSPERLWEALLRGDDLVTEIPPERWDAEEYYDPEPGVPGRSVSKWGAFLDDVAGFDSEFFGINEREAIAIDPQQRLLLETSWETMEHAGLTREAQAASGALGLMKAILALQHGVVPRNLHFTRLPGEMAGIDTKLFVPQEIAPWPGNDRQPRRAAVSSYGLSGTNVHAILEQAPAPAPEASKAPAPEDISAELSLRALGGPLLFALSSTSADELRRTAGRPADWVQAHDDVALSDLAYTLARRRAHRPVRTALTASSRPELTEALREVADGDTPYQAAVGQDDRGPVWVFSGQGSQWAAMGAQLLATEPVFAATVAQVEPLIACESGFSVTNAMSAPQVVAGIDRIQPTLFTMQVALAATLRSYGVRPGAVIGHSLGEVAAAVVAGALSPEDGVRVACRRSRLMSRIAGSGAMASVELPAQQVLSELTMRGVDDVVVAAVASPQTAVIGGATQTVRELVGAWEQRDVLARVIAVDVASHSPQVDPILDELSDALAELNPMTPDIPFYSATLYDAREVPVCDAGYWVHNLRRMVRFAPAVQAAWEDGYRVFAELAPHPLLTHAVEQTARGLDMPMAAVAGMRRELELPHGLHGLVADLHSAGAALDFSVLYPTGRLVDAPLPTWTHRGLLLSRDGQESSPTQGACTVSVHPLLGPHVRLPEEPERHVWQVPMPRPTAGWTPSPCGAGPRVCRRARSRGESGPRSDALPKWPRASTSPTLLSLPTRALTRSKRCCATTAATPGMRRSRAPRG